MRDLTYPPIIVHRQARLPGARPALPDDRAPSTCPRTGGALLALNHIRYVDFIYGGFATHGLASGWSASWPSASSSTTAGPAR